VAARPETPLILKRGSPSRSSGQWGDDDYDVLKMAPWSAASTPSPDSKRSFIW
jgi:hypothetical protein